MTLTQDRLKTLLLYDQETGVFTNRITRSNAVVGEIAGYLHAPSGYWHIMLDYRKYKAHRLVWLYRHGHWPRFQLDHINGNRGDNRLVNLRECTGSQNGMNAKLKTNNTSGYKGVYWDKANERWRPFVAVDGKNRFLGRFKCLQEAVIIREAAAREFYGEFVRS